MPYWCQTSKERLFWAEKRQKWLTDEIHRRTSLNTQHLKNLKQMWSTAAKHHSECSFCQLWTGNWGWHLGLAKLDNRGLENHVLAWWVLICAGIGGSGSSQWWWCPPIFWRLISAVQHTISQSQTGCEYKCGPKSLRNVLQHFVESMPPRIRAALRTKKWSKRLLARCT